MKITTAIFGLCLAAMLLVFGAFLVNRVTSTESVVDLSPPSDESTSLRRQVNDLERQVAELQHALATTGDVPENRAVPDAERDAFTHRLVQLERRLDALDDTLNRQQLLTPVDQTIVGDEALTSSQAALVPPTAPPTEMQQLQNLVATLNSDVEDPAEAIAVQTLVAESLAASEFGTELVVDNARCSTGKCLIEIEVPFDQDPELAAEWAVDEIPSQYGGYSTFISQRSDGAYTLTLYLQKTAAR